MQRIEAICVKQKRIQVTHKNDEAEETNRLGKQTGTKKDYEARIASKITLKKKSA